MNIWRRLLGGEKPEAKEPMPLSLRQQVFNAPALFNRATRRAVGMLSDIWRWDIPAVPQAPRYIRRHFTMEVFQEPKTRRERKMRARVTRIAKQKGL